MQHLFYNCVCYRISSLYHKCNKFIATTIFFLSSYNTVILYVDTLFEFFFHCQRIHFSWLIFKVC